MSELIIPVILMLLFVLGEALLLRFNSQQTVDWHEVIFNLNSGHIMLWLFRGLEVLCYGLVFNHFSLNLFAELSPVWVWCFAILAWDFGFYWLHRLHHRLAILWAVHVVHHQGHHYNLSLGVRNSWYSSLTSIPFFIVLAWLGVPLTVFLSVSILHYTLQFLNHMSVKPHLGWLEKIFVTPTHHRVHHINDRAYSDSNYGGSFIFWDKLFGTFKVAPEEPYRYGVKGDQPSNNPFIDSNRPFWRLLKKGASASAARRQYYASAWMLVSGAMLLFALVLGYIQRYGYGYHDITLTQIALFMLLAGGSIALGGISQGQHWGVFSWFLLTLTLWLLLVIGLGWTEIFWQLTLSVLLLHSLSVLCGWGRRVVADV